LRSSRYIRLCFASPVRPFPNSASCLCTLYAHAAAAQQNIQLGIC
jgi:hypothetical protein